MAEDATVRSLQGISMETLLRATTEAFRDYPVDVQMTLEELESMLRQNSVSLDLSAGLFDGGNLVGFWINGVRVVDGRKVAYDSGTADDQVFYGQHDAQWIEAGRPGAGNILVFNNGRGRPEGAYSSIEELTPPVDVNGNYTLDGPAYGPDAVTWSYTADPPTDLYSQNISGTQRLGNGNTLIVESDRGRVFEVTPDGEIVWKYINPAQTGEELEYIATIFDVVRLPPSFPTDWTRWRRAGGH